MQNFRACGALYTAVWHEFPPDWLGFEAFSIVFQLKTLNFFACGGQVACRILKKFANGLQNTKANLQNLAKIPKQVCKQLAKYQSEFAKCLQNIKASLQTACKIPKQICKILQKYQNTFVNSLQNIKVSLQNTKANLQNACKIPKQVCKRLQKI